MPLFEFQSVQDARLRIWDTDACLTTEDVFHFEGVKNMLELVHCET